MALHKTIYDQVDGEIKCLLEDPEQQPHLGNPQTILNSVIFRRQDRRDAVMHVAPQLIRIRNRNTIKQLGLIAVPETNEKLVLLSKTIIDATRSRITEVYGVYTSNDKKRDTPAPFPFSFQCGGLSDLYISQFSYNSRFDFNAETLQPHLRLPNDPLNRKSLFHGNANGQNTISIEFLGVDTNNIEMQISTFEKKALDPFMSPKQSSSNSTVPVAPLSTTGEIIWCFSPQPKVSHTFPVFLPLKLSTGTIENQVTKLYFE